MHKRLFLKLYLLLIFLSGCSSSAPLNSERIAQRYGSYGIEILFAGDQQRISNLYSEANGRKTMRTLALVEFTAADAPEIANEHGQVLGGGSIGAVFKDAGWTIDKGASRYCLSKTDRESLPELERMGIPHPAALATRIYVFHVRKGTVSIDYATITEIYHPDYVQADANLDDC